MRSLFFALGLLLVGCTSAAAQNITCPTRGLGDSTNACASTAFTQAAISAIPPLAKSGNTNVYATVSGALPNGNCVKIDPNGNFVDSGSACGAGVFLQNGSGAVAATTDVKLKYLALNAKDFGAVGDNTADDTAALQNWLTACQTYVRVCFLDKGTYKISAALNITGSLHIVGASRDASIISLSSPTQYGLNISSLAPVILEGFQITSGVTPTGGAGLLFDNAAGGRNTSSIMKDMRFLSLYSGIDFERASYWTIDGCQFQLSVAQQVIIKNLYAVDEGDSLITNSFFIYATSSNNSLQSHIVWLSSGGLRVENSKFLTGFRDISYNLAAGANTGTLVVVGNSFENFYDTAIFIQPANATNSTLSKVVIATNEFLGFDAAYGIRVFATSTPTWFNHLTIASNVMQFNGLSNAGAAPHGIDLTYVVGVVISANYITCTTASTGSIGVLLSANVYGVGHAGNSVRACATNTSDSSVSNPTPY